MYRATSPSYLPRLNIIDYNGSELSKRGKRVRWIREFYKENINSFSKKNNITKVCLKSVENGYAYSSYYFILNLTKNFRISPLWIIDGITPVFFKDEEIEIYLDFLRARTFINIVDKIDKNDLDEILDFLNCGNCWVH